MAGAARSTCASRPEREGNIAQVRQKSCCINTFTADVEIAFIAMVDAAVDDPARAEGFDSGAPQLLDVVVIAVGALFGELGRRAEADAQLGGQGSGAKAPLLPAAVNEWGRLRTLLHPQRADPLGTVDLVRRDRDQIGAFAQVQASERLDRIAEH